LNFFAMTIHGPDQPGLRNSRLDVRCADLPGYGYAKVPSSVRDGFAPMVEPYLRARETLRVLLVLVDARRGPDDRDIAMIEYVVDRPIEVIVVGTKGDKLAASDRGLWTRAVAGDLKLDRRNVLITSARTKDGLLGKGGLLSELARRLGVEPA
jgi:GTP-binding protein